MKKTKECLTYCNPLAIPSIPRGKDEWYSQEYGMFSHENKPATITTPDYRSISDPTVFYHGGKWYLYPSYGMAWVSEDFANWEHVRTEPYCPKYSPTIIPWGDKFLLTAWFCPLYESDSPTGPFRELGEFIMPDGSTFRPCDPGLFADDDGRIYLYAFSSTPCNAPHKFDCRIVGYELDRDDPRRIIRGPEVLFQMNPDHVWERKGFHNQNRAFGWVEGPHMVKHNGRYYLIYGAPDTCNSAYAMGVYYSDNGPLDNFIYQKKNPLTYSRYGVVAGAGHGCVEHGPDNTLWAFYTVVSPTLHRYERRIGMDLVAVDENGELYCPHGVTDTPQYAPGVVCDPVACNSPEWVSLTGRVPTEASSQIYGREALYAVDEHSLTWWEPQGDDPMPTLTCNLQAPFCAQAMRVWWRELDLDYGKGVLPAPVCYTLEGKCGEEWVTLLDLRENKEEMNIDYRVFSPTVCTEVRLRIHAWAPGTRIGVIDFAVFGAYPDQESEK